VADRPIADKPAAALRPASGFDPRRAPTMPAISIERPAFVQAAAAFPPAPLPAKAHDAKVVVRDSVVRPLPAAAPPPTQAAGSSRPPPASAGLRDSRPAPGGGTFSFPYAAQSRPMLDATSKALIALIVVLLAGLIVIVMLLIQRR